MGTVQKNYRAKYLLKNTTAFALGNFGVKLIGFFLVPLYTNLLTPDEYGTIDLIAVIATIAVPLLTLNVSDAVMRFALDKNADHHKIISAGLLVAVVASIAALVIPLALNKLNVLAEYSQLIYWYIVSFLCNQVVQSTLRAKEMLVRYSVGSMIQALFVAVLNIVFLLRYDMGIYGYYMAYILANAISSVYAFFAGKLWEHIRFFKLDWHLAKEMFKYSVFLIPTSLMWWVTNSSDKIMLSTMAGVAATGLYAVSYKIPTLLSTFSSIFNVAWSYSAIKENESDDREEYNNAVYNGLVSVVLVVGTGLLLMLKPFMRLYVAQEYYSAWIYTPWLIAGTVFLTLGSFMATMYTVYKDSKGFLKSGAAGAILNIILNVILIPACGALGAAVATGASYFAVFVYRAIDTRKYIKINILQKQHLVGFGLLFLAVCTVYLEGIAPFVLLAIAFLCTVLLFAKQWKPVMLGIIRKVRGVDGKR